MNINDILRFFRKNRRLLLAWIGLSLCAGIVFALLAPARHTAVATILFDTNARHPADQTHPAAPDPTYTDSQVQVLQSDEVLGRLFEQYRPLVSEEAESRRSGLSMLIAQLASLVRPATTADQMAPKRAILTQIKRGLSIRRIGVSDVVEIAFSSQDAARSAAIANAVAKSYIDDQIELARKPRDEEAARLAKSLAELRDKAFTMGPPDRDNSAGTADPAGEAQARFTEQQDRSAVFRALYNNLLQRHYTEFGGQFSFAAARIISAAEPPIEWNWSRGALAIAVAMMGGAFGGMGHALLRHATDRTLRNTDDVQRLTGLELIATVPKIKRREWESRKFGKQNLQLAYQGEAHRISQAIGRMAVGLLAGERERKGLIIGVVAATPQAGASVIASHLAKTTADTDQKTLLVDANWQKSTTRSNPAASGKFARTLANTRLQVENLDILALRPEAAISELNASLSILATLQHVQPQYDRIVIDFHCNEQTADSEASMAHLNYIVIVVEAGRTSLDSFRSVLRAIPTDKIVAVVVNKGEA